MPLVEPQGRCSFPVCVDTGAEVTAQPPCTAGFPAVNMCTLMHQVSASLGRYCIATLVACSLSTMGKYKKRVFALTGTHGTNQPHTVAYAQFTENRMVDRVAQFTAEGRDAKAALEQQALDAFRSDLEIRTAGPQSAYVKVELLLQKDEAAAAEYDPSSVHRWVDAHRHGQCVVTSGTCVRAALSQKHRKTNVLRTLPADAHACLLAHVGLLHVACSHLPVMQDCLQGGIEEPAVRCELHVNKRPSLYGGGGRAIMTVMLTRLCMPVHVQERAALPMQLRAPRGPETIRVHNEPHVLLHQHVELQGLQGCVRSCALLRQC